MTYAITSKELRTNFPWVKEKGQQGGVFIIYYRSKPLFKMELFQEQPPEKSDKPTWQEWSSYKQEMIRELGYEKKIAAAKKNPKTSAQILAERSKKKTTGWEGWQKMIIKGGEPFDAVQIIREDREET